MTTCNDELGDACNEAPSRVTRRTVLGGLLGGAAAAAVTLGAGRVLAETPAPEHITPASQPALPDTRPGPRMDHAVVALPGGRLLLIGGRDRVGGKPLAGCRIWDSAGGSWHQAAPMAAARAAHTAVALPDGRVLVIGGVGTAGTALASAELYDPRRDRWTPAAALPQARQDHAAAVSGRTVLVTGGRSAAPSAQAAVLAYDIARNRWQRLG